ncbi:MAG: hypothetical protein R2684_06015 [Pyrinomonadaceae bacterium]
MKKRLIATLLLFLMASSAFAQEKTVINSQYAKRILSGKHMFSLQWISWDWFGSASVTNKAGVYYLKGSQKSRENDDLLTIDGVITEINRYNFKFNGKITTKVSHIAGGEECVREGDMTFAITGKRKYWRLQEMDNPCDGVTDYVDIYMRK